MMEPKWLYRLESTNPQNGLWYDSRGAFCWGLNALPDCKTKDLPMEYDERYRKDGRMWFSSCTRLEDLSHWYSLDDALELIHKYGFRFARYLATEYVEYPLETTFIKETCLAVEPVDISEVFPQEVKTVVPDPA